MLIYRIIRKGTLGFFPTYFLSKCRFGCVCVCSDDDMLDLSYKLSNQDRFEPNRVQRVDSLGLNKDTTGNIVVEKDNKSKSPTMSTSTSLSQRRKAS